MCTFKEQVTEVLLITTHLRETWKIICLGKARESLELTGQRLLIYNRFELEGNLKITTNQIRLGSELTTHKYRIYKREQGVYHSYTTGIRYKKCVEIIQFQFQFNSIHCLFALFPKITYCTLFRQRRK